MSFTKIPSISESVNCFDEKSVEENVIEESVDNLLSGDFIYHMILCRLHPTKATFDQNGPVAAGLASH